MANYLNDPTQSFVPTPIFTPDFASMDIVNRTHQGAYNQNLAELKGIASSIFNAQLTNTDNQLVRSNLLKEAENKLKNLSKVNLALPQNEKLAKGVFESFYKDDEIAADIVTTKYYKGELAKAMSLRDSKDPDVRSEYWDLGVQDVQDGYDQLKTAKRGDGSILNVEKRRYVPKRDIEAYLTKAAKDEGLKVVYTSNGDKSLIYEYTNGAAAVPNFKIWAASKLGNQFDDMYGVMGRSEMKNRTNQYVSQGMDIETARDRVAHDFINDSKTELARAISNVDVEIATIKKKAKEYVDDNGFIRRPEDKDPASELKRQLDLLEQQKDGFQKSVKNLDETTTDKYKQITQMGSTFFGNLYKERAITNFAFGYANGHSEVKVSTNQAYQNAITNDLAAKNFQLEALKENREERKLQAQIEAGAFYKKFTYPGAEDDEDGISSSGSSSGIKTSTSSGGSGSGGIGGQYVGLNTIDPTRVENPYQDRVRDLATSFVKSKQTTIDGLTTLLPLLGIEGVGIRDAMTWASGYKSVYESPNNRMSEEAFPVANKVFDFLKKKGYPVKEGSPSTVIEALKQEVAKTFTDKHLAKNPLNEEEMQGFFAIQNGQRQEETWARDKKLFDSQVTNVVQEKFKKSPLAKINDDGSYGFKTADDIKHDFPSITVRGNGESKTFNSGELADLYLNGRVKFNFSAGTGFGGSTTSLGNLSAGNNSVTIDGTKYAIDGSFKSAISSLEAKYGTPQNIAKQKNALDNSVGELIKSTEPNAFLGHNIAFNVRVDRGEESSGYRLVKEVANVGNRMPVQPEYANLLSSLQGGGGNMDIVSGTTFSTKSDKGVPSVTLTFDSATLLKDEKFKQFGLDEEQATELVQNGLKVYLKPGARGEVISNLPKPHDFQTYGQLMRGEPIEATELEKSIGFNYEVIPDNIGNRSKDATSLTVNIRTKVYDKEKGAFVDAEPIKKVIPVDRMGPDEVIKVIDDIKKKHFIANNNIFKQSNEQKDPTFVPVKIF